MSIGVTDGFSGDPLYVEPKAFLRGAFLDKDPTVAVVVTSEDGRVGLVLELTPEKAHILSERIRQEAELASVAQEENI